MKESDQNIKDIYKKELSTFVINNNSLYPPLSSSKNGDTRLEDIKNFLASSKNQTGNKKKEWPKYITDLEKMKCINKKKMMILKLI